MTDRRLWARVSSLDLGGSGYPAKLAGDAGWSQEDATRVAGEYKRFLYLTQVTDVPLAPPPPVDAAWRTHLLYTRAYAQDLETGILGKPLHRDPETVRDPAAQRVFWDALRDVYRAEFGTAPPPDIWVNPRAPTYGGAIAGLMIVGIGGGILSFLLMFLLGWLLGLPVGGAVDTTFEKVFTSLFLLGWAAGFLSPLWAWLITRGQKRLKSARRTRPGTISIGIGYERS